MLGWLSFVRGGYRRSSLVALALLVLTGALVGYRFSDLLDANGGTDWLLTGIWLVLASLSVWGVRLRDDLLMVAVGLGGGAVIETWGTRAGLWSYFTGEQPPPWILPAWPIAALAIERLSRWLAWLAARHPGWPRLAGKAYWVVVPAFVVAMVAFMRPALGEWASQAVVLAMGVVMVTGKRRSTDMELFAAGTVLGYFLETWGTTRGCWTYHTAQTPPPIAVVAHGFAALAFERLRRALVAPFQWPAVRANSRPL